MSFHWIVSRGSPFLTARSYSTRLSRRFCNTAAAVRVDGKDAPHLAGAQELTDPPKSRRMSEQEIIEYSKLKIQQMRESGNLIYISKAFPEQPTDSDYVSWFKTFKKIKHTEKKNRSTKLINRARIIYRLLAAKIVDVEAICKECSELGELLKNPPSVASNRDNAAARSWAARIQKILQESPELLTGAARPLSHRDHGSGLISLAQVPAVKSLIDSGAFDKVADLSANTEDDRRVANLLLELRADESRYYTLSRNEVDSLESWLIRHSAESVPTKKYAVNSTLRSLICHGLKKGLLDPPSPRMTRLACYVIDDLDKKEKIADLVSQLKSDPRRVEQLTPAEAVMLKHRIKINMLRSTEGGKSAKEDKLSRPPVRGYSTMIKNGLLDRPREDLVDDRTVLESPKTAERVDKIVKELQSNPKRYKTITADEYKLLVHRIEVNKRSIGVVKRIRDYLTSVRGQASTADLTDKQLLSMKAEFEATEQYRNRIQEIKLQAKQARQKAKVDNLTQKAMKVAKKMFLRGRLDFDPDTQSEEEVLKWYRNSVAEKVSKKK
ncbi:hypothetical protein FOL47_008978 [Perkinsus chesapeaki]|uniref:Uncharacterized protein n=1 Tax=Perkinsus chesapeaki TaxID=330153 RepID=A0A7J6N1Z9_PERCH|nr:hypothetical protein FOL47_008978 [Perkinsus chesapeaki]